MDNAPGPIRAGVLNEALRNFACLGMVYQKCTLPQFCSSLAMF